jgi:hypothetical protein
MSKALAKKIVIVAIPSLFVLGLLANLLQVWDWVVEKAESLLTFVGWSETSLWIVIPTIIVILLGIGAFGSFIVRYSKDDTPQTIQSTHQSNNADRPIADTILDKTPTVDDVMQTEDQLHVYSTAQRNSEGITPIVSNYKDSLIELLTGSNYATSEDARLALCYLIEIDPPGYISAGTKIFCRLLVEELFKKGDILGLIKIMDAIKPEYERTLKYKIWTDVHKNLLRNRS